MSSSLPSETPPAVAPSSTKPAIFAGRRVVVVEDEGITQMQLHRILKQQGMDVVGAAISGPEGVEVVLQTRPDLVLMDIRMPGEYDGIEAARRILEIQKTCIIMLTAFSEESYKERARQLGACGYITKPIDRSTLVLELEAALQAYEP